MIKWTLQSFSIDKLKDHPKNPRKLTKEQYEQLKASIEKFGLIDKPVCTKDGRIIGGHQRKNILKKLGVKKIDCYVPDRDLSEKEIDELCIRLNKATGNWDYDILANEWEQNELFEWGFSEDDLSGILLDDVDEKEEKEKAISVKHCPHCGKEI